MGFNLSIGSTSHLHKLHTGPQKPPVWLTTIERLKRLKIRTETLCRIGSEPASELKSNPPPRELLERGADIISTVQISTFAYLTQGQSLFCERSCWSVCVAVCLNSIFWLSTLKSLYFMLHHTTVAVCLHTKTDICVKVQLINPECTTGHTPLT